MFRDLDTEGALTGNDIKVVKRMNKNRAGSICLGVRMGAGIIVVITSQFNPGAQFSDGLHLDFRRCARHKNGRVDA